MRDLPGLPLQAASEAGLCELLWRGPQAAPARSSDEEALSRFIQLNGLENEAPAPPGQPFVFPTEPLQPAGTDLASQTTPVAPEPDAAGIARSAPGGFVSRLREYPRLILGFAFAAAVLLALALIFGLSHKRVAKPEALETQPAPSTPALHSGAIQPAASLAAHSVSIPSAATQPRRQQPSEPAPKDRKPTEPAQANPTAADAAKAQAGPPVVPAGNCELNSNLLPKMLDQAERSREQGNYAAALRQFRAVLACDRNNARARSGLDLTELSMRHQ
jgi:hypothetical protein